MQSTLLAMAIPKLLTGNSVLCSISCIAVSLVFGGFMSLLAPNLLDTPERTVK